MTQQKQSKAPTALLIGLIALLFIGSQSVFQVHETEQVIVLQFGNPVHVIQNPGLKFKIPFIQNVVSIDKRILEMDPQSEEILLNDQKRLVVDTFLRYTIHDPLKFYQTLQTDFAARSRLREQVNSSLRSNLGKATLAEVLSPAREQLMEKIATEVNADVQRLGLTVADVRIVRADLPKETSEAIFARMVSERQREASEARAEGQEKAQEIRSIADKDRTIIISEAEKKAQIVKGEADAQAIKIYADAFNKDKDFYSFYRSLEAYKKSMKGDNTTFVISPESEFFKFFGTKE